MTRFRIDDVQIENAEQADNPVTEHFVGPDPVQVGIRFYNVQMRVHRLGIVGIFCTEPHVFQRVPILCKRLEISAPIPIKGILLNAFVCFDGQLKGLFMLKCAGVFCQSIQGKGLSVHLFPAFGWISFYIHGPEKSLVFFVVKTIHQKVKCPGCHHFPSGIG